LKKYEVLIMPSAEAELEAAYRWLFERDPEAAGAWFNGALDAFLKLETLPERCPLAPESDAFDHEIRQLLYGRRQHAYRILYDISGDTVRILHIRHGAREPLKPGEVGKG
jgi:toxin ParE1/3/4